MIVSWYEDVESGVSFGNVVIGARSKQELEDYRDHGQGASD